MPTAGQQFQIQYNNHQAVLSAMQPKARSKELAR
jgi:hypothetical protein